MKKQRVKNMESGVKIILPKKSNYWIDTLGNRLFRIDKNGAILSDVTNLVKHWEPFDRIVRVGYPNGEKIVLDFSSHNSMPIFYNPEIGQLLYIYASDILCVNCEEEDESVEIQEKRISSDKQRKSRRWYVCYTEFIIDMLNKKICEVCPDDIDLTIDWSHLITDWPLFRKIIRDGHDQNEIIRLTYWSDGTPFVFYNPYIGSSIADCIPAGNVLKSNKLNKFNKLKKKYDVFDGSKRIASDLELDVAGCLVAGYTDHHFDWNVNMSIKQTDSDSSKR